MKVYKIFDEKFKKNNLREIYGENVRFKSAIGNDKITHKAFSKKIDEEIELINRKVMNGSYKFTTYRQKLISKGKSKPPREVSIPSIRDKITLVTLKDVFMEAYKGEINTDLVQSYMNKIKMSLESGGYTTVVKLDMKNFYDTINHQILLETLKKKTKKVALLSLVEKAIKTKSSPIGVKNTGTNERGVPQGLAISNILSTIYLREFDQKQILEGWNKGYRYFRYVDDILILCKEKDAGKIAHTLIEELQGKYALEVHEICSKSKKSTIKTLTEGFEYLGYQYKEGKFTVRKGSIEKLEKRIDFLFNEYRNGKYFSEEALKLRLNYKITGFISLEEEKYGWLFFFSQLDDLEVLYKLDSLVRKLLKRNNVSVTGIKSFVRTYHEILYKLNKSNYIPRLSLKSPLEKIEEMRLYSDKSYDGMSEKEINDEYRRYIEKLKKENERDMQGIS